MAASDMRNRRHENEVPKKHKGLSVFMVIMFIMGEQAGAGMMAISRAFVDTEWYGVAILLYYSVVAGLMGILLGKSWMIVEERWPQYKSQKCGNPYPTMGEKAVAPWMRIPVSICSYFSLLGGDVVYILVISKFLQQMFPQLGMSFCVWIVLLSLILLPFTFLGSPHDFWFIAVLAISTTAVCCVLALLQMYYEFTAVTHVPAPAAVMTTDHFFLALSTFSFAYAGTPAFPSFQNDMKNRNKFSLAVIIAYIGLILMYVSMGLAGKYVYGDRVSGNVLESLSASPLRTAAQVLIIIHFAAAFQIMVNSPAQEIEEYLKLPKTIWKALDVCLNQPSLHQAEGIIIYSDSRSALDAIQNDNIEITQKIHSLLNQLERLEKNCILQWFPAHVGIEVFDADALAKYKIIKQKIRKDQICEINSERKLTKTITRLRTKHYKGMAIHPDSTRTYRACNNCPGVELTPTHIFSCPAMVAALQKIDLDPEQQLYTPKIVDIAAAVMEMHGDI
ncbi:hypothetical protein LAZ67_17000838 [Cordylochernes scorpioides]|uniref:Amino acid transporter transmembrane domain-containing protein n=1 Tax=Cordylochernes scorpioides TaxID=51811 RepID=A0ABY6LD22_9ARAC|nr:hypothetical protein LAZ67_17000838 [Cordylochernes scorpioides]